MQGFERVVQGLRVRGSWRPNRNCHILTPNLWPSTLFLSHSSDSQPEPWGPLCWVLAFFTASYQHLLWTPIHQGFPRAPSAGCCFPYHISSPTPSDLQLNSSSNSTELYNRSTPTRSLKSNVQSSSSGNNCHAVQRSLSSGESLYSGTVGPSPCPILLVLIRPRDLFRLLAIGMCHFLPVHHLGITFLGRVEGSKHNNFSFRLLMTILLICHISLYKTISTV